MFDVKGPYLDVSGVLKYSVIVQLRECLLFSRVISRIVKLEVTCLVHYAQFTLPYTGACI